MKKWVWFVAIFYSGLYVACSIGDDVSGSSFETENSIAFEVRLNDGNPAALTSVVVRPSDYVAKSNTSAKTNLLRLHIHAKCVNSDDNQLKQRIPTANVERGVALGKAQILSKFECFGIVHALVENFR